MAQQVEFIKASVGDKVGRLAEVTAKAKDAGVNILAICAWTEGETGKVLMVTDDNQKACAAVSEVVDDCEFAPGVCVKLPNQPGALNGIARILADAGINVELVYATAGDADEVTVVLHTSDDAKAAELI